MLPRKCFFDFNSLKFLFMGFPLIFKIMWLISIKQWKPVLIHTRSPPLPPTPHPLCQLMVNRYYLPGFCLFNLSKTTIETKSSKKRKTISHFKFYLWLYWPTDSRCKPEWGLLVFQGGIWTLQIQMESSSAGRFVIKIKFL